MTTQQRNFSIPERHLTDHTAERAEPEPGRGLRSVLWLVLLVSAAANASSSALGLTPIAGVAFGLIALGCIAGLVVHHYRTRRH